MPGAHAGQMVVILFRYWDFNPSPMKGQKIAVSLCTEPTVLGAESWCVQVSYPEDGTGSQPVWDPALYFFVVRQMRNIFHCVGLLAKYV